MRSITLAVPCLFVVPLAAVAGAPTIDHAAVKCIVAGKYPQLHATFAPAPVARARTYFRPQGVPSWYYVDMAPDSKAPPAYAGVLPKPTKKLVGQKIDYYVEAASPAFETARTLEYDPVVVTRPEECREMLVAAFAPGPPLAVFPSLPAGFAVAGGVPVAATVAVVGGGAAAAGTVVAVKKDDDKAPQPSTTAPASPNAPAPPPAPPTVPGTTPPLPPQPIRNLEVSCQAQPRQGIAPLRVLFTATAAGGTGSYDFAWTFGDGETSSQVTPGHTYTRPGTYEAAVHVTSGDAAARCARTIVVEPPADEFELTVRREGSGLGSVTGPNIACGTDCSEVLVRGTVANLSAVAAAGSTFTGWSGACSGTDPCAVNMDQAKTVTATFEALSTLTVTLAGSGTGAVTGPDIACLPDCTETYVQGTPVTLTATPQAGSQFVGWSGACTGAGACSPTMTGAVSVTATFQPILVPLTVAKAGSGAAFVTLIAPGINCGTDCSESYPFGTNVTIERQPVAGAPPASFDGWSGDCSGAGTCTVGMTVARSVTATYTRLSNLAVSVVGPGLVSSIPLGIDCTVGLADCREAFPGGQVVTLRRHATPPTSFVNWTGDCAPFGAGETCTLTMDPDRNVGAVFFDGPSLTDRAPGPMLPASLNWSSRLEAPETAGRVLGNGADAGVVLAGVTQLSIPKRAGVNRVEAQLQSGSGKGGTWRFELLDKGALEAGSLRALEGEVALVTEDTIVFRLSGRAGERVAFTFKPKG